MTGIEKQDRQEKKEAVYDLIRRAQQGDEQAKEKMILENTALVKSVACKFLNMGCEWEDLMQIGFIGLTKALMRFDLSYGLMFSTYAVPMIIGEIRRFLRDDGKIKTSRDVKTNIFKMRRLRETFYAQNGRHPRISELAELMETGEEDILTLLETEEATSNFEYIDDPQGYEKAEKSFRLIEDEERKIDILSMKDAIRKLDEHDRRIIALRYQRDMTQQQTAKILGTSQVQISRAEKKILAKMRRLINEG